MKGGARAHEFYSYRRLILQDGPLWNVCILEDDRNLILNNDANAHIMSNVALGAHNIKLEHP
jgi:hypothetical protein